MNTTPMTESEINVKLAEALGWKGINREQASGYDSTLTGPKPIPNYTGSYDAVMPEVLKLDEEQALTFVMHLTFITKAGKMPLIWQASWLHITATPLQLSRALLATLTGG